MCIALFIKERKGGLMKKLRKRVGSLLLVLLIVLSSFTPFTPQVAYGGVAAGSNDNNAGGNRVPATYNIHGWGCASYTCTGE